MKSVGQKERILEYLKTHEYITALDAQKHLGIMRLAARIADLKADGYRVQTARIKSKNRFGEDTIYAGYKVYEKD